MADTSDIKLSPREAHQKLIALERERDAKRDERILLERREKNNDRKPRAGAFQRGDYSASDLPQETRLAMASQRGQHGPRKSKRKTVALDASILLRMMQHMAPSDTPSSWIRDAVVERLEKLDHRARSEPELKVIK
jgi:hypothetical protein